MNTSRLMTGAGIIIFSLWLIIASLTDEPSTDYIAILIGILFIALGVFIIFNKKEDEIEKIKNQPTNNKEN